MKHSCFTVALTDLTYQELAQVLADAGYDGVEWRVSHPNEDSEMKHVNLHNIEQQALEVKSFCDNLGLDIPVIASYEEIQNLDRIEKLFKLAKLLGARLVRVNTQYHGDSKPHFDKRFKETVEYLKKTIPIAKQYGLKQIMELHMGTIHPGPSDARRIADNFSPDDIGFTLDMGNMVIEGLIDYELGIQILGPYLAHVHVKNTAWFREKDGTWKWKWTPLSDGMVDWPRLIKCLKEAGYDGYLSQEDFCSFTYEPGDCPPEKKPERIAYVKETLIKNREYIDSLIEGK